MLAWLASLPWYVQYGVGVLALIVVMWRRIGKWDDRYDPNPPVRHRRHP